MLETLTLLLALAPPAPAAPVDLDLSGAYCAQLGRTRVFGTHRGCCIGRMDECAVPILGTLCYCDTFCNRTYNPDCCPDYFSHCAPEAQELVLPEVEKIYPKHGCFYAGRVLGESEKVQDNCNVCQCVAINGTHLETMCLPRQKCLIEPDAILLINRAHQGWTASNYSEFWGRTLNDGRTLRLGTLEPSKAVLKMSPIHKDSPLQLPRSFDARSKWPGQIAGVQDQGWCGSSWAESTAAVATDRFSIMSMGAESPRPWLSSQHLLDCNNNREQHGCMGGHLDRAWHFTRKFGLVPESCYPRTGNHSRCRMPKKATLATAKCPLRSSRSPKARAELYRMGPVYRVAGEKDIMREIITSGPVQATMEVFPDLYTYRSGIYRHIPLGDEERSGFHSVRILGWGEERDEKFWLVANSWGEWWGESGLFRIRRGVNECQIEDLVLAAWAFTHVDPVDRDRHANSLPRVSVEGAERVSVLDNTIGIGF